MATKAELAAELAYLKQQMAERDANTKTDPAPVTAPESGPEAEPEMQANAPSDWTALLTEKGLWSDDTAKLLDQLTKEFEDLSHEKPVLTVAAAFGLGFILGRMSK